MGGNFKRGRLTPSEQSRRSKKKHKRRLKLKPKEGIVANECSNNVGIVNDLNIIVDKNKFQVSGGESSNSETDYTEHIEIIAVLEDPIINANDEPSISLTENDFSEEIVKENLLSKYDVTGEQTGDKGKNNFFNKSGDENISINVTGLNELSIEDVASHNLIIEKNNDDSLTEEHGIIKDERRVINMQYFWNTVKQCYNDHIRGVECSFKDFVIDKVVYRGYKTQFFFKCLMCNYKDIIWSEPTDESRMDVNVAAVVGSMSTGIGFSQLQELSAAMDIRTMSSTTYRKLADSVIENFIHTAQLCMIEAAESEKKIAIENGDVINGIPYITVVADGCWMKRTYGHGFDSLSGVGLIVGYKTQKVLFAGVRNKFCSICDTAARKNLDPRPHKCYKNFDRNVSSTKMESDAIAQGFKNSIESQGLIYRTLIGDNDSNVHKAVLDNDPYNEQGIIVQKIECVNHLYRNMCTKLFNLADASDPKYLRNTEFVNLRKLIKSKISTIRREVEQAASRRRAQANAQHEKGQQLKIDILNVLNHVFDDHTLCQDYGFECDKNGIVANTVSRLTFFGLYDKLCGIMEYLSRYSESLLLKYTNNGAESCNAIICKAIGGKRVNFCSRGLNDGRIAAAIVQNNTQQTLTEYYSKNDISIPENVENLEKRRQLKVSRNKSYRAKIGRENRYTRKKKQADSYYGPQSQKPDMDLETFTWYKENHFKKLQQDQEKRAEIEAATRLQSNSELWCALHRNRLTASAFGAICRMKHTTLCDANVKSILYPSTGDTVAMRYGRENEKNAITEAEKKLNIKVKECGLFIDEEFAYLGATPDGLINDDGIIEVKCPYSAELLTAKEAIQTIQHLKSIFKNDKADELNRRHKYFYQIQGQLHITKRIYCVFVLWTPKSMITIRVEKDDRFWENNMLPHLSKFYNECIVPEIIDSRHNRHMPIRNPPYIIEARKLAEEKKNNAGNKRKSNTKNWCNEMKLRKAKTNENIEQSRLIVCAKQPTKSDSKSINVDGKDEMQEKSYINDEGHIQKEICETQPENSTWVIDKEDSDCICEGQTVGNEDEVTRYRKAALELNFIVDMMFIGETLSSETTLIADEVIDAVLRIIKMKTSLIVQSVLALQFPRRVNPVLDGKSIQIIGGLCCNHWRCLYYDSVKLYMYDSIYKYPLSDMEKQYINIRYPKINISNIIHKNVTQQKDDINCGVFAIAFAVTLALYEDPSQVNYSMDSKINRQHILEIIKRNELLPFPTED